MVTHLTDKIRWLEQFSNLATGDIVLDIGSNDATTLKAYSVEGVERIGIDPTGAKFREFYPDEICLIEDFFSAFAVQRVEKKRARIITSIAMFYPESVAPQRRQVW